MKSFPPGWQKHASLLSPGFPRLPWGEGVWGWQPHGPLALTVGGARRLFRRRNKRGGGILNKGGVFLARSCPLKRTGLLLLPQALLIAATNNE